MNQIMDNRGERNTREERDNCERRNTRGKSDIWKKLERHITGIRRKAVLRTAGLLAGALAFVWWCVLYPELCFPQDTYEAVAEAEEDFQSLPQTGEEDFRSLPQTEKENLRSLLQAEEEQVIVKSRLLEWLKQHGYIK